MGSFVPTRREFLRTGAAAAGAALAARRSDADPGAGDSAPGVEPGNPSTAPRARVVDAHSGRVVGSSGIDRAAVRDLLDAGLCELTGKARASDAWQSILRSDDVIGIKFNRVASHTLGTTEPFAAALMQSLADAEFDPARCVIFDVDARLIQQCGAKPPDDRFGGHEVDFGCGRDSFVAALERVTALINVPFLKTHHLALMTGCLKNLSHGLIRRPARFHADGCDPAISRIVASEPIRSRLRLNVVNALRMLVEGGSRAAPTDRADSGRILLSFDPVAADAVGFERINGARRTRQLPPLLPYPHVPRFLVTSRDLNLGQFDAERMDLRKVARP